MPHSPVHDGTAAESIAGDSPPIPTAAAGDEVVVEVSAPTSTNSPLAGRFVTNRTLTARVVMVKE